MTFLEPREKVRAFLKEMENTCRGLWGRGPEAGPEAHKAELQRAEDLVKLLRDLGSEDVKRYWSEIKALFYSELACPYCAMSARVVNNPAVLDQDEDPLLVDGKVYRIACEECPVALMAHMRGIHWDNGCHRTPEYAAAKHALGDLAKALVCIEGVKQVLLKWAEVLSSTRSFNLESRTIPM